MNTKTKDTKSKKQSTKKKDTGGLNRFVAPDDVSFTPPNKKK